MSESTRRTRIEPPLGENDEHFRLVFDQAAIGMALAAPDGSWMHINQALRDLLGYSDAELVAKTFDGITHPDDRAISIAKRQQLLDGDISTLQLEKRYAHKDGHYIWTLVSVALVRDAGGGPMHFVTQIQDITKRKRAERALRESEERHRLVACATNDLIWDLDLDTKTVELNTAVAAMFTYEEQDVCSPLSWWVNKVHPDDRERVVLGFQAVMNDGGDVWRDEFRFQVSTGRYAIVRSCAYLMRDADGIPVRAIGVTSDMSEQRTLEEQLRQALKMEAIGRLAGGIAHDFNNLLTAISSNSELALADLPADHPVREEIQEIRRATNRASGLTRQLLAFSRKQILQPKVLQLNDVVTEAERMLRRVVSENISLVTTLEPALGFVRADPGQLAQVLVNLVVNARDAMPSGGVVTLGTANATVTAPLGTDGGDLPPGRYVTISVGDSGHGMDMETRARIFEPFFTTKGPGRGTGLGLSTVYGIITQSDGSIQVESTPGQGSTFTVYLPRVQEQPDDGGRKSGSLPVVATATETVLLVEDEAIVRGVARRILERHGYRVLEAEHGTAALLASDEYPGAIDLLLTDVVMPEMGGLELAEHLRERRPELTVLFMSGYTEDAIMRQGILAAGAGFVEKPFSGTVLAYQVRALLDKRPPYSVSA